MNLDLGVQLKEGQTTYWWKKMGYLGLSFLGLQRRLGNDLDSASRSFAVFNFIYARKSTLYKRYTSSI